MSRQIQIRRGTSAEHENFTGALGEVTYDTTAKTLRVHDGETAGGTVLAKQSTLDAADYVVETQLPTAENNYTWYRKYKSGWVEQGGSTDLATVSGTLQTIVLPITMANTRYTIIATEYSGNSGTGGYSVGWRSKTTTYFVLAGCSAGVNIANTWDWKVSGVSA